MLACKRQSYLIAYDLEFPDIIRFNPFKGNLFTSLLISRSEYLTRHTFPYSFADDKVLLWASLVGPDIIENLCMKLNSGYLVSRWSFKLFNY